MVVGLAILLTVLVALGTMIAWPEFTLRPWVLSLPRKISQVRISIRFDDRRVAKASSDLSGLRECLEAGIVRAGQAEIRTTEKLQRNQRRAVLGKLAGGLAHDLNNALTALLGHADLLGMKMSQDPDCTHHLNEIRSAAARAGCITRQFLRFDRRVIMEPVRLDLNETLVSLRKHLVRLIGEDVDLQIEQAPDLGRIRIDPAGVEQIILTWLSVPGTPCPVEAGW